MAFGNRGFISQSGNFMQISNALVEEVVTTGNNRTGYIVVSYVARAANGNSYTDYLRLNVTSSTAVINFTGQGNCLCNIREGMWINALFSSKMTRSNPPQANAFVILVRRDTASSPFVTTTTTILTVDKGNNAIIGGDVNDPGAQVVYLLTDSTTILNRFGIPVQLSSLRAGQTVKITHAATQTSSLPPQTTAYSIQVL